MIKALVALVRLLRDVPHPPLLRRLYPRSMSLGLITIAGSLLASEIAVCLYLGYWFV